MWRLQANVHEETAARRLVPGGRREGAILHEAIKKQDVFFGATVFFFKINYIFS